VAKHVNQLPEADQDSTAIAHVGRRAQVWSSSKDVRDPPPDVLPELMKLLICSPGHSRSQSLELKLELGLLFIQLLTSGITQNRPMRDV